MHEACISVIQRQQLPTLKEILLRFPLMLEICRAFDQEAFIQVVAGVGYTRATKSEGMPIDPKTLYLFFAPGRVYRRGREERTEKNIRLKSKGKIRWGQVTGKQGQAREVAELGHFEETNCEHYYYPYAKNTLVLHCELERLTEPIAIRIRELRAERLRFLHSLPLLAVVERGVLEEHLHGFSFAEMKFGTVRQPANSGEVLIVKSGSVEVGVRGLQGRSVEGSCVVGLGEDDFQVKASSEIVHGYCIKWPLLQTILARGSHASRENSPRELLLASAAASPLRLDLSHPQKENRLESSPTLRAATSLKKRTNMRSMGELGPLQKQRRLNLRKHFSNFYNQVFEEFSEKKARQLALGSPSQEKLVLYEIKLLERKQPRMEEINERLRGIRLQKLRRCKAAIAENTHLKELKNVGVAIE